ncbi:MAG: hypothetical protein KatS3mg116_3072 [Elioraea sp.]|nr:MAG: hypothetical protein KatS3mg116_3072 [Elioraea sp.]
MSWAGQRSVVTASAVGEAARAFIRLAGTRRWRRRIAAIEARIRARRLAGTVARDRHALELAIDRLAGPGSARPSAAERAVAALASDAVAVHADLSETGRGRFMARLDAALEGEGTLVPLFHLLRTAALNRARGFAVRFSGLEEETPHDLLIEREGRAAEIVCAVVSADEGRWVHRGDWFALVDRINPELQSWLAAHPGRYILKMTLPDGLDGTRNLAAVQARIAALLAAERKSDHSETAVLRLDPLLVAQAEAGQAALAARLRAQFGEEAHFAVAAADSSVFVMAARAGRPNEVAAVLQRRLAELPARLSGTRPGILAVFVEDTDRTEWRSLRERLELEGATRNFLTAPEARHVVAVTCASRFEMLGQPEPVAARGGELRYRNPAHPLARDAALAPAVLSQV